MHNRAFPYGAGVAMAPETCQRLASELRMAGEAFITTPTGETFNLLTRAVTALSRAGVESVAMKLACCALYDVYARYEIRADITVTTQEAARIRAAIASINDDLSKVTVPALKQAIAEVDVHCASVGA